MPVTQIQKAEIVYVSVISVCAISICNQYVQWCRKCRSVYRTMTDMRKRIYRYFPKVDIAFEQKYRYSLDLQYLVRTMAAINGKFGMFSTSSPDFKGRTIQAKREISMYLCDNGLDFSSLDTDTADSIIGDIEPEGTLDFKVSLLYSYLDENYKRVAFSGDNYIVRANLDGNTLTLQVQPETGPGRTDCGNIADTILEELRKLP